VFDKKTDEGKIMLKIIDLNEMAFTELLLSIDVSSSSGKIAFGIVKKCKNHRLRRWLCSFCWGEVKDKI
jgi:hypothetical protein